MPAQTKKLDHLVEIEILDNLYGSNPDIDLAFDDGKIKKEINKSIKESVKNKSILLIPCYSKIFNTGSNKNPEIYYFYLHYDGDSKKYTIYDDHKMRSGNEYTEKQSSVLESTKDYIKQVRDVPTNLKDRTEKVSSLSYYANLNRIEINNPITKKEKFDEVFDDITQQKNEVEKSVISDTSVVDHNRNNEELGEQPSSSKTPLIQENTSKKRQAVDIKTDEREITVSPEEVLSQWEGIKERGNKERCLEYVSTIFEKYNSGSYSPALFKKGTSSRLDKTNNSENIYKEYNKKIEKNDSNKEEIFKKYKDRIEEADYSLAKELQQNEVEDFITSFKK